jgi:DNA modification methylase
MTTRILIGDSRERLRELPDQSVNCCVTSPPYFGLRDYGMDGQMGLEATPDAFVAGMVELFREVRRVLRDDGTLWLNLGDSYAASGMGGNPTESAHRKQATNSGSLIHGRKAPDGSKPKDLIGIPWRVALALQADGWYLRQDIIWSKPNPMPESVTDRCTKAHEYIFMLSKSARYYFDAEAIAEPVAREFWNESVGPAYMTKRDGRADGGKRQGAGPMDGTRNKRSVWTVASQPFSGAHFATFPPALIEPCILAGCPKGGTVLDCFGGAGTTGLVADRLGRDAILIELNPEYAALAQDRLTDDAGLFAKVEAA